MAAIYKAHFYLSSECFNTQPPEGGCKSASTLAFAIVGFNTQPPEGGCFTAGASAKIAFAVSTHSHPKVAASKAVLFSRCSFSFNTQPPEGGCKIGFINLTQAYSFNTQPPEGGCHQYFFCLYIIYSFNTQPPEGGCLPISKFTC
mgnify:FL=1